MNLSNLFSQSDFKKYIKFILIIFVGLFLAGGYFFWIPKYQEYQKNKTMLDGKDEEMKIKKEYLRELNGHLNNVLEYEEELLIIEEGVPTGYSLPALYSFMQSLASRNRVILSELEYQAGGTGTRGAVATEPDYQTGVVETGEGSATGLNKIVLSFEVSGEYSYLKDFIAALHKNSRFFNISKLTFSSPQDKEGGSGNIFDFSLSFEVVYYKNLSEDSVSSEEINF